MFKDNELLALPDEDFYNIVYDHIHESLFFESTPKNAGEKGLIVKAWLTTQANKVKKRLCDQIDKSNTNILQNSKGIDLIADTIVAISLGDDALLYLSAKQAAKLVAAFIIRQGILKFCNDQI